MSTEARALAIVEDALGFDDPDAREAFVAERCSGDSDVRARVEALLALDTRDFRLMPTESFARPLSVIDAIPDRIGPYQVTGEVARGGMGAVVRAERDDGVFAQTVAIKLIRGDLASPRAQARFAEERRILARLRHPGIVRILDGGEAEGRPWLAMDYVDGLPVTEALDAQGADRSVRLDAIEAVCEAVAYAHRNLVIHADIKPSNVLMSSDGRVHLLDFGIARLIIGLDADENGDPYPLTKGYAAPERGVGIAPTIASDVFSLGVLLLRMLGYHTPEHDVVYVADTRLAAGLLDGDLAAIAARALAENPAERYPDVPALLADIRRHRAFRPIVARGDAGWRYTAGRFVMRHRRSLALTSFVALTLITTSIVSTVQYVRADRARTEADTRFIEVRRLAQFMLSDLSDAMNDAPGTLPARAQLAATASTYLDRLRVAEDAPVDLRLDTAQGYRRLATLQGLSGVSNLGQPAAAARSLDRADALLTAVARQTPDLAELHEEQGRVALARWTLAPTNAGPPLNATAERHFHAALAIEPSLPGARLGLLATAKNRAMDLTYADRPVEAMQVARDALSILRRLQIPPELYRERKLLEVNLLARLGDATYYAGDPTGALTPYRRSMAVIEAELARRPSLMWTDKLGEAAFNISSTLAEDKARIAQSLKVARVGAEAMRRALSFGPDALIEMRLAILYGQEALILSAMGRHAEAAAVSSRGIAIRKARLAADPRDSTRRHDLAVALANHSDLQRRADDRTGACSTARDGIALWQSIRVRGDLADRDARIELPKIDKAARQACGAVP